MSERAHWVFERLDETIAQLMDEMPEGEFADNASAIIAASVRLAAKSILLVTASCDRDPSFVLETAIKSLREMVEADEGTARQAVRDARARIAATRGAGA